MALGNWAAWPHPTSFSHLLLSLIHKASAPRKMHCLPQSSLLSLSYSFPCPTGPSCYLTCSGKGWNIHSPALPFGLFPRTPGVSSCHIPPWLAWFWDCRVVLWVRDVSCSSLLPICLEHTLYTAVLSTCGFQFNKWYCSVMSCKMVFP